MSVHRATMIDRLTRSEECPHVLADLAVDGELRIVDGNVLPPKSE